MSGQDRCILDIFDFVIGNRGKMFASEIIMCMNGINHLIPIKASVQCTVYKTQLYVQLVVATVDANQLNVVSSGWRFLIMCFDLPKI